jgi:hypothetical protein
MLAFNNLNEARDFSDTHSPSLKGALFYQEGNAPTFRTDSLDCVVPHRIQRLSIFKISPTRLTQSDPSIDLRFFNGVSENLVLMSLGLLLSICQYRPGFSHSRRTSTSSNEKRLSALDRFNPLSQWARHFNISCWDRHIFTVKAVSMSIQSFPKALSRKIHDTHYGSRWCPLSSRGECLHIPHQCNLVPPLFKHDKPYKSALWYWLTVEWMRCRSFQRLIWWSHADSSSTSGLYITIRVT